jgi:hypothetical protein
MKIRRLSEWDRGWLEEVVKSDKAHSAAGLAASHWIDGGEHSLVYEEDDGTPLVVLKVTPLNVVQIDLQFCGDKPSNAKAFLKGAPAMIELMKERGYTGIVAQPLSPAVERMLKKYKFIKAEVWRLFFGKDQ